MQQYVTAQFLIVADEVVSFWQNERRAQCADLTKQQTCHTKFDSYKSMTSDADSNSLPGILVTVTCSQKPTVIRK